MKEQSITYNTAVLAREKGFKAHSKYCYDPLCRDVNHLYVWNEEDNCSTDGRMKRLVYAPTQSLLQKWLREEHRIDMTMRYADVGEGVPYMVTFPQYPIDVCDYHLTYELALEEGLEKALNLIK